MTNARLVATQIVALALAAGLPASGQSVVSTHSGLVYFFVGSVFLGNQLLEQKFGRFPEVGEGVELHTAIGRVEVLLTPGVSLRLDQNTSIRMLSTSFADTRVELLSGSVILEATEKVQDTSVKLVYKNWQVQVPKEGACRIDTESPQVRAYKGQVTVGVDGNKEPQTVEEGEVLPLAAVLVPAPSTNPPIDDFKDWAMNRSQAISADNTVAAGIVDDPDQMDTGSLAFGGYSYFPMTGALAPGIGTPYGLSFWSPFQSTLSSMYIPAYSYGMLYPGRSGGGWPNPRWVIVTSPFGPHSPRPGSPRIPIPAPRPLPHPVPVPSSHIGVGVHVGAHR
jgi:hypothetical protein